MLKHKFQNLQEDIGTKSSDIQVLKCKNYTTFEKFEEYMKIVKDRPS